MEITLSCEDKKILLDLARKSISDKLQKKPVDSGLISEIEQKIQGVCGGAFVTLKINGNLRGCIGNFGETKSLPKLIHKMALASAFGDPRFNQLKTEELSLIEVEISVLSELFPIEPQNVVIGKHGLYLTLRNFGGVLLPQVPVEWNWDREEFLENLCMKAGLPVGSHLHEKAVLEGFTADVFSESSLH
ncbi:MAG: AmmeMemoRadiSam system protein A [Deltaproteobacteria bacterium]|nr:AmmeMemoRadiSam system protein A [Deltaproteobacteria bacterium]